MVYKFVVLSDENESFIREFELLNTHTLLDFHNALQDELEFDKSQMASFFTTTDNWEKEEEFTLLNMGTGSPTMESAILEDVIFRKNQKLLYIFDFFNERSLFVEYTGETKESTGKDLPACTNAKGIPPKQVVFGSKSSHNLYNNIIVSGDYEEDIDEIDDLYIDEDDEDALSDFADFDGINDEEDEEE